MTNTESPRRYILRAEGMNIEATIYDTADLSTIRGSGLILLGAFDGRIDIDKKGPRFRKLLEESVRDTGDDSTSIEDISVGASTGVYLFEANDDARAAKILARVRRRVAEDEVLKYLAIRTVVVPVVDETRDDAIGRAVDDETRDDAIGRAVDDETRDDAIGPAVDDAVAAARFRQMTTATSVVPSATSSSVCSIDAVRPGDSTLLLPTGSQPMSRSVEARRNRGKKMKRRLVKQVIGDRVAAELLDDDENPGASRDLTRLASWPGHPLDGKVAVIHGDGNKFSQLRLSLSARSSLVNLKTWDKTMDVLRRKILTAVVESATTHVGKDVDSYRDREGDLRLEILLWGGDEMVIVVPAWWATRTLAAMVEALENFEPPEPDAADRAKSRSSESNPSSSPWRGRKFTFSFGVALAHASAPIHRLTRIASTLVDEAKDRFDPSVPKNLLAYQVLETFDHVGLDFAHVRDKWRPSGTSMILTGDQIKSLDGTVKALKDSVPHSFVVRTARALVRGPTADAESTKKSVCPTKENPRVVVPPPSSGSVPSTPKDLPPDVSEDAKARKKILADIQCLGGGETGGEKVNVERDRAGWVHLAELWDYAGGIDRA